MSLVPLIMQPAFRYGNDTPWGGTRLRELYNKNISDPRCGESLEVSTIPGLNSQTQNGTPLSILVERYGKALIGSSVNKHFPLLLKLIDARKQLSVQVHPNDAYALKHENKFGKSEGWVILHAEPNAHLVYGFHEGISHEQIRKALEQGNKVEKLLRYIPVKAGDVFYIPAGTIHAIGAGIVLYEIQQSSDVTYRLYDWERKDKFGNKRELHISRALQVCNLNLRLDPITPTPMPLDGQGILEMLLDTPFFQTLRYRDCSDAKISSNFTRFEMLTALAPAVIRWRKNKKLCIPTGHTVLLPAECDEILLTCKEALLSRPCQGSSCFELL